MRLPDRSEEKTRVDACVKRWQERNEYGRSVGRGLSTGQLVENVARETGASKTTVRAAFRRPR